jgi:hypothetical protein
MISLIQTLHVGNALRIFLDAPAGASACRLLRKVTATFSGHDDPDALLVLDELERSIMDTNGLVNGTLYYYCAFYFISGAWTATAAVSSTPASTYQDRGTDVLSLVRERLDLGLQAEIARATLRHDYSHIPVLTAPPLFDDKRFPLVTVHLQSEAPDSRALGEMLGPDDFDADENQWGEAEGWLASTQLMIIGWSLNPDERIELRKALRRIVVANLPVFSDAGMLEIMFSAQDVDDFESFNVPLYQVNCAFSCTAPVLVGGDVAAINEVEVIQITE